MATPQEIAQALIDDFNNRTYQENAATYFTDDTVHVDLPTGREGTGIEVGIQNTHAWVQAFPDAQAEVISHDVDGNTVTTTIRGTGTFTGEMMTPDGGTIPGNGSPLDLEYVQTITVEGDKVTRLEADYDMQGMMGQIGMG